MRCIVIKEKKSYTLLSPRSLDNCGHCVVPQDLLPALHTMSKRQAAKALRELLRLQSTGVPQRTFTVATPAAAPILGSQGLGKIRDVREVAPQQTVAASALAQPVDETTYVPDTVVDAYGAVSVVSEGTSVEQDVYKNIDGHRFEDGRYAAFISEISKFIPEVGSNMPNITAVTEVQGGNSWPWRLCWQC